SSRRRHTRSDRDWSSDVCSSDLIATAAATVTDVPPFSPLLAFGVVLLPELLPPLEVEVEFAMPRLSSALSLTDLFELSVAPSLEIGRASCRERGEVAVGGVVVVE